MKTANGRKMSSFSTYELEERLACLHQVRNRMYEYRHVFNFEDGERVTDMVADMIMEIGLELDKREVEELCA